MTQRDRLMRDWADRLCGELGLDPAIVDVDAILDTAAVAAHEVVRPAAPVTTFIIGYAAGMAAARGESEGDESILSDPGETARSLATIFASERTDAEGSPDSSAASPQ